MADDEANGQQPWRLVNFKAKHDVIDRIDAEARRLGLNRTSYMLLSSDPTREKELKRLKADVAAAENRAH